VPAPKPLLLVGLAVGAATLAYMVQYAPPDRHPTRCKGADACAPACDHGDAHACDRLSDVYGDSDGVPRDLERQRTLAQRACDGQDADGCFDLARIYARGIGVAQDAAKSETLLQRAHALHARQCDARYLDSCYDLALDFRDGRGTAADDASASRLLQEVAERYERACNRDDPDGCEGLADMTREGTGGLHRDASRAAELYERACDLGDPTACALAGYAFEEGGAPPRAMRVFAKACSGGVRGGCGGIARIQSRADEGLADAQSAAEYAKRELALLEPRCAAGAVDDCDSLAFDYEGLPGYPKDPKRAHAAAVRALDLHARGCAQGYGADCAQAAALLATGVHDVGKDLARASDLLERACTLGDASSCAERRKNLDGVAHVAMDSFHTCVVRTTAGEGSVWCWGVNSSGELGDGTTDGRAVPVRTAGLDGAIDVGVGLAFSCALGKDGAVWCWGDGTGGQLGDGRSSKSPQPVRAADLQASHLSLAYRHACAVGSNGGVACWGDSGHVVDGATVEAIESATPDVVPSAAGVTQLAAGATATCWVADRGLFCWGFGPAQPTRVTTVGNVIEIALQREGPHGTSACVRVKEGAIACFQVGEWKVRPISSRPDLHGLAVSATHACAIGDGGTVWCWGDNARGALGDGTTDSSTVPVQAAGLRDANEVAVSAVKTCAVMQNGTLWCWGEGDMTPQPVQVER
jgi:TPR repeat protein